MRRTTAAIVTAVRPFALLLLVLAPVLALLVLAGCGNRASSDAAAVATVAANDTALTDHPEEFVGNAACAECHQKECDLYKGTRHANTMHPADQKSMGVLAPPRGPVADSAYAIRDEGNGGLRFERVDDPKDGATMRYALGSGKDAITFVGDFTPHTLTEFRMTFLPPQKRWALTPGQAELADLKLGVVHQVGVAKRCIGCHAMKTLAGSREPDPAFLGVGCESCHGAGKAHIAAAKAGAKKSGPNTDLKIEDMSAWGAAKVNATCDRCHRSIDNVTLDGEEVNLTGRFQGYGLEMSECYKKSGDHLSCVTCHNPHTDVETDPRAYEQVCLACHTPNAANHDKACPVNPKDKCISCHMPRRPIFPDKRIPILMADHLITSYKPVAGGSTKKTLNKRQ